MCVLRGEVVTASEGRDDHRQGEGPGTVTEAHTEVRRDVRLTS